MCPNKIGSKYLKSFVIAQMDSRVDFGDSDEDWIMKKLYVQAQKTDLNSEANENEYGQWELIFVHEVEISDGETTCIQGGGEAYRMPFPFNLQLRKSIIREIIKAPKFFIA